MSKQLLPKGRLKSQNLREADFEQGFKKTPESGLRHKTDSLRLLPSGPDLVQIAYSASSPVIITILYEIHKSENI